MSTSCSSTKLPQRTRCTKVSGEMRGRAASLPTGSGSSRGGAMGRGTSATCSCGVVGEVEGEEEAEEEDEPARLDKGELFYRLREGLPVFREKP